MSNSTKPSSSSGYDERFVVPLEASRRGAHRARVSPIVAILPVAAVVGIVVGAIALVYVFLGGDNGSAPSTVAAGASPSASAAAQSAPADATSSSPASSTLSPGTIDKSISLDVYNGSSPVVSGLAGKAAKKLVAGGWKTGTVGSWTGGAVPQTTVYYATTEQKATAQAVARSLGYGVAKLSAARAGDGIAVVVGNDFAGSVVTRPTADPATRTSSRSSTASSSASPTDTAPPASTSPTSTKGASSTAPTSSTKATSTKSSKSSSGGATG